MAAITDNSQDEGCAVKARRNGEITFTLRAQDESAPTVIAEWIKQNIDTAPDDKLRDALESALKMREWPNRKAAD